MTTQTSTDDLYNKSTSIASTLAKITLGLMLLLNLAIGTAVASEEPTEEELCSNALTEIIDRVMFFVFNLAPIVTFTVFAGAFAAEKLSGNRKKGEYRGWRNNAFYGTVGLVILGQMGGWFMGTFLNVSPACLDNFTYMMLTPPTADVMQVLTMMPF